MSIAWLEIPAKSSLSQVAKWYLKSAFYPHHYKDGTAIPITV